MNQLNNTPPDIERWLMWSHPTLARLASELQQDNIRLQAEVERLKALIEAV